MTRPPVATDVSVELADAATMAASLPALGELLADAVESGSSVNFVLPFSAADGAAWWRSRLAEVESGEILPLLARVDGRVEGVTLLIPARQPNAPHRAEVSKVLVHRRARGRGIGTALMEAVEQLALTHGRWLLLLDTHSGSDADRLYRRLGWQEVGVVPDHSLTPEGALCPTTIFRKDLRL